MSNKDAAEKVAVFGSAFNPPSLGHLSVIQTLSHFDKVLLVPNYAHAWEKKMANFDKRCNWVNSFIMDIKLDNVSLCSDERQLFDNGAVTTWVLLNHLQNKCPNSSFTFVLGPDNFLSFTKFYKWEEIMKRWSVLACPETIQIRSTHIREKVIQGKDISLLTTPTLVRKLVKRDFE